MWELSLYSGGSFDFRPFADVIPPPDTDISAFVRNSSKGYFIHLYSATSEKKLQQRVLAPAGWRAETFVADVPPPDLNLTQIPSAFPAFSGSFPNSRKIATAATVWSNGSGSIYYSGNGHIREASRNLSTQDSWRRGALDGTCAPGTSLCCVSWGDSNVSLFYQTADAIIHEMRYNGQNWSVSTFTQAGVMPGTALAAVQNQNADRVMIFYQNNDNVVCSRRAINWVWDPPVQICTARSAAAFSATTWSNTQNIRLFLDIDHSIEEYSGSFDGNWVKEQYRLSSDDPVVSMTAISWLGPKFKLYVRKDNSIMEVSYTQGAYSRNTKLESPVPPQCPVAIAATGWIDSVRVYTQSGDGFIREGSYDPHVIPWNPDQALRIDQVFSQTDLARRKVDGWRRATLPNSCAPWSSLCCLSWGVDSTRNVSVFYQKRDNTLHEMRYDGRDWSTTGFVQADAMPGTAMAEVHNENVNGQLFFFQDSYGFLSYRLYMQQTDNSLRELRCGRDFAYALRPFALDQEPNRAARNTAIAAFRSTRVNFGNLYWAASDKALRQRILSDTQWLTADSIGDLSICGPLGAALAGPFTLTQLVDQTKCLSDNITEIRAQNTALSQCGQELSDGLIPQLRPFADTAVEGILALAHSVEQLSSCVGNTDDLVKTCKTQAETVDKRFKLLYNQARVSLVSAVNLATDVTYQQSTIELRGARITALLALSADMRGGEEKVVQLRQEEIDAAQKHLDILEKARKDA
ncbi:hypothetical protein B0H14DRAFT_3899248 [Mycena olivaceomarginata]|nr:hypothetical protein B0H14DRAFT_3899248 [Mycena olivaceomarginata]